MPSIWEQEASFTFQPREQCQVRGRDAKILVELVTVARALGDFLAQPRVSMSFWGAEARALKHGKGDLDSKEEGRERGSERKPGGWLAW